VILMLSFASAFILVQANFYLKGLYGDPETPITATPLAHMLHLPDNTAFVHPVTGMLIFQKWNLFGRRYFYYHVLGGLAGFFFLIMGFVPMHSADTTSDCMVM
jgi:hypothetical protein